MKEQNKHEKKNKIVEFEVRDVDVGFPFGKDPVNLTPECLNVQGVFGQTTLIYAYAEVEPHIAVNPKCPNNIVIAWQNNRVSNGGSLEIGIAYSHNGGKSWKQTTVPIQLCMGGVTQRTSDVWLSYSPDGRKIILNALVFNVNKVDNTETQSGIIVSISNNDGKTWSFPKFISSSQAFVNDLTFQFHVDDKNSITWDTNDAHFIYSVWDRLPTPLSFHTDSFIARSNDRGKTWFPPVLIYDGTFDLQKTGLSNGIYNDNQTIDNQVIVLPQKNPNECEYHNKRLTGEILNFFIRIYAKPNASDAQYTNDAFPYKYTSEDIVLIRSKDKGASWTKSAIIITQLSPNNLIYTGGYTYDIEGHISGGVGSLLRTGSNIASYAVNPVNGNLYVVYQADQFRSDLLPQIGLTYSRDGGYTWSPSIRVNRTPQDSANPQAFTATVSVNEDGYVAIMYCDFRNDNKSDPNKTLTDVWIAIYKEIDDGLKFIEEHRLSKKSYIAQNGPLTTSFTGSDAGIMTNGDYAGLAAVGNKFFAAYTKSFIGPFSDPITIVEPVPPFFIKIQLDQNLRTSVFSSILEIENDC